MTHNQAIIVTDTGTMSSRITDLNVPLQITSQKIFLWYTFCIIIIRFWTNWFCLICFCLFLAGFFKSDFKYYFELKITNNRSAWMSLAVIFVKSPLAINLTTTRSLRTKTFLPTNLEIIKSASKKISRENKEKKYFRSSGIMSGNTVYKKL